MNTQEHAAAVKRIYENILVLLDEGQFPGNTAAAVFQAQRFVISILAALNEEKNGDGKEVGDGVQPEADAGRVGGERPAD